MAKLSWDTVAARWRELHVERLVLASRPSLFTATERSAALSLTKELDRLAGRYPLVRETLAQGAVRRLILSRGHGATLPCYGGRIQHGIDGLYDPDDRSLGLSLTSRAHALTRRPVRLGRGRLGVGSDVHSILRHELGHAVYDHALARETLEEWAEIFFTSLALLEARVSLYAASDPAEAFAECFSAYTSREHEGGEITLPRAVTRFFRPFDLPTL